jgi:hypothetical protein
VAPAELRLGKTAVVPSTSFHADVNSMKAYLVTTGSLFGLLALAHVWQIIDQWPRLLHDPSDLLEASIGLVAAALCLWAVRLLRSRSRGAAQGAAV